MTRKRLKGNSYKHRKNLDQLGSKRKRSTFNLKVQANATGNSRNVDRFICSTCGTSIVHPYMGEDNVVRCARCAVRHISASRS